MSYTQLKTRFWRRIVISIAIMLLLQSGCAQIRLPAIDPSGNSIFLPAPNSTQLLGPRSANPNPAFVPQSGFGQRGAAAPQPALPRPSTAPAFQNPPTPPPCDQQRANKPVKRLTPTTSGLKTQGQRGQIIMTPSRIIAPVGSEVVVLAGICGPDGFFLKNQPLEWLLSNNSVGEFIEVGGTNHQAFNTLVPPTSRKINGQFAKGRTGLKKLVLSRGTPTPVDDIELAEGQTFISVSSSSPGTSYVTGLAPNAEGWDRRRASTTIHWVDGQWAVPLPSFATAGTVHPLTTVVRRSGNGSGIKDWEVRYTIVGGAPAEIAPAGSQTADVKTNSQGQATVQLRQPAGQFEPGTTQIRVDIVRPPVFGESELIVESGITTVTWTAPALAIRAIGPRQAQFDDPFNYRVEVTNPGDQIARNVVVRTKNLDDGIEFISSNPKPTEFGRQLEWQLGEIAPGSPPQNIDIQLRSKKRGNVGVCFEVVGADGLQTEACTQTEIVLPCIGVAIDSQETARVGDSFPFNIRIENQCDEPLENIEVRVTYDPGLLRPGKSNPSTFTLPRLAFGDDGNLPLTFQAQQTGRQCVRVDVTAQGLSPQSELWCIDIQPINGSTVPATANQNSPLTLSLSQGQTLRVGDSTIIEARIVNRSSAPINQVQLVARPSAGLDPREITEEFEKTSRLVDGEVFTPVGRINPGQTIPIRIRFVGIEPNEQGEVQFSVTSLLGGQTQSVKIPVRNNDAEAPNFRDGEINSNPIGIPGNAAQPNNQPLTVEVTTLTPNIGVGQFSQVQFSVTNNQSVPADNVDIDILVPGSLRIGSLEESSSPELIFVDNQEQVNAGRKLIFRRILSMNPGQTLTGTVSLEGVTPGQATVEVQAKIDDKFSVYRENSQINVGP